MTRHPSADRNLPKVTHVANGAAYAASYQLALRG
jgi:hypothetical protein